MKTLIIAASLLASCAPSYACTNGQTAAYNLAVRSMYAAVDISKTVGGPAADKAVLALMDLVESIDKSLPTSCGVGR